MHQIKTAAASSLTRFYIKHQSLPTTTVGGGSVAAPPWPSLFHCHAYLLVADLNAYYPHLSYSLCYRYTTEILSMDWLLAAASGWMTMATRNARLSYFASPSPTLYILARFTYQQKILRGDDIGSPELRERLWKRARAHVRYTVHARGPAAGWGFVPGLPSCALPVVVSRSMATMGKSAAEQAGREAMVVATASLPSGAVTSSSSSKRKRDTEETESGSDEPQQVEQPTSPTPAHHAVLRTFPSLQGLVDVCRYELDGSTTPPTAAVVRLIRGLMDKIGPDDVGLGEELRFFNEIAVFFLPQGTVMPLHDHPGMTVFSKLLIGWAHIEGYDWIRGPRVFSGPGSSKLAEKVLDKDVTEDSGAWVSFPDAGGNMRRFVAGEETHCAFLDIRTPPSSTADRRRCTFYKDIPYEPCRCTEARGAAGMVAQDG
ncbi:hypothetical protein HU200_044219 [Digitaria exilis]|uniref:cysteine dioxygenase n=1 Tax=Digitaria exilis TaxID=1010633 RepID=A0A835B1Z6_9POAL|nr:hypothetical protein HU200_044219 [Digitaria exilis]